MSCKPHDWLVPLATDPGLRCAACDRLIRWASLDDLRWAAIRRSYRRRHGARHGAQFIRAVGLATAMEAIMRFKAVDQHGFDAGEIIIEPGSVAAVEAGGHVSAVWPPGQPIVSSSLTTLRLHNGDEHTVKATVPEARKLIGWT